MRRREALRSLAMTLLAAACSRKERTVETNDKGKPSTTSTPGAGRMPILFAAHGAPMLLDDVEWLAALASWARAMPRPSTVLVLSAHWTERPAAIGATTTVPLVYDFFGFPDRYYQTTYPSPGSPQLAERVRELFRARSMPFADHPNRGLDHGAYIPLKAMYPDATVPVLQLSLPGLDPAALVALGRLLSPLRDEGVLLFGSGFLTHNMQFAFRPGVPPWASEFDHWAKESIERLDIDALCNFQSVAPSARMALPTWEHYAPLLVAAGAADESGERRVRFPIEGWWMNSAFTKRSVQFG